MLLLLEGASDVSSMPEKYAALPCVQLSGQNAGGWASLAGLLPEQGWARGRRVSKSQ